MVLSCTVGKMQIGSLSMEISLEVPKTIKENGKELPYDLVVLLLGI